MADLVPSLIESTRRHLMGQHQPQMNRLATAVSSDTQDTITFEFAVEGVSPGSIIAINDELMYVWSRDKGSLQAIVQRGVLGTTAAASHALGSLIEVNPRFPTFIIRDELKREIRSWHPRLYAVVTKELTVEVHKRAVDLDSVPADFFHILEILRQPRATRDSWYRVRGRAEHNLNTADFPSGSALFLDDPVEISTRIRVTYARPFDLSSFDDSTDLVTDVLLAPEHFDIASYGAAWRLVSTREIKRTDTDAQGEPRDAQEVPPGHILQTARQLKALRDERIAEENRLLVHRWGVRK